MGGDAEPEPRGPDRGEVGGGQILLPEVDIVGAEPDRLNRDIFVAMAGNAA